MIQNEIKFSEREILALIASYYMACKFLCELLNEEGGVMPFICHSDDKEILINMRPRLIELLDKYENEYPQDKS